MQIAVVPKAINQLIFVEFRCTCCDVLMNQSDAMRKVLQCVANEIIIMFRLLLMVYKGVINRKVYGETCHRCEQSLAQRNFKSSFTLRCAMRKLWEPLRQTLHGNEQKDVVLRLRLPFYGSTTHLPGLQRTFRRSSSIKNWRSFSSDDIEHWIFRLQIITITCLVLHYNSMAEYSDRQHSLLIDGTFVGFTIILVGLFAGYIMNTPINKRIGEIFVISCFESNQKLIK